MNTDCIQNINLSAAFDPTDHDILLKRLEKLVGLTGSVKLVN